MKSVPWLGQWIRAARTWWRGRRRLTSKRVAEEPDRLARGIVYVVGAPVPWMVVVSCPCGCDEAVHLSLLRGARPRWEMIVHEDGTISLSPSILRTSGCRSHFWLQKGRIGWVSGDER